MEQVTQLPIGCMEHNTLNLSDEVVASEWLWSETEHLFFTFGIPLILLIGTIGNIAFMFVVYSAKKMQTITNAYLVNIAIADLTFVVYTFARSISSPTLKLQSAMTFFSCEGLTALWRLV